MPKYVFRHTDSHKTQKCSVAACVDLPYWIQSKSIKKYGEHGSKFIYDRKKSVTAIGLIISRFTLRQHAERKPYTEINSNPVHGLITDTRSQTDGWGFHTTRFTGLFISPWNILKIRNK